MYNSVFPLYDEKVKLLLPFVSSTIKGKWREAVKVLKVDFDVVPQVALWIELNMKTSRQ